MTIYAASSIDYVAVSAEGHGGCGLSHRRPVVNGAPQNPWALDCPQCEDHLRHDPLWSATLSELPETHDEQIAREDFDKRGARDRDQILALAMAKLAGVELPESLLRPITGNMPHLPVQVALCKSGHQNAPIAKFCSDCGVAMSEGVTATVPALAPAAPPAPPAEPVHANGAASQDWSPPRTGEGRKKPLKDWRLEDLQSLAVSRGLDPGGNRTELITRLRDAKKVAA